MLINLNGALLPGKNCMIAYNNSGLRSGLGAFETILFRDGQLEHIHAHYERLLRATEVLELHHPWDDSDAFCKEIFQTIEANSISQAARIRIQVFGGDGSFYDNSIWQAQYLIEAYPLQEKDLQVQEHYELDVYTAHYKEHNAFSGFKFSGNPVFALAMKAAKSQNRQDMLILNTQKKVAETCVANIFWIKGQKVYTPAVSEACIDGIMRQHIIRALQKEAIPFEECSTAYATLLQADEVFVSNSIKSIQPVTKLGERVFNNPTQSLTIRALL